MSIRSELLSDSSNDSSDFTEELLLAQPVGVLRDLCRTRGVSTKDCRLKVNFVAALL